MSFAELAKWYVLVYLALVALQPPGLFDETGCPRPFGVRPGQTLLPAWLVALGLALQLSKPQLLP